MFDSKPYNWGPRAPNALAALFSLMATACGAPMGSPPPPGQDGGPPPPGLDSGSVTPPPPPADCNQICNRIVQCAAESGEQVPVAECIQDCVANRPSAACQGCFTGPCTSTCGGPCIMCVAENCGPPPPRQDSGTTVTDTGIPVRCGTGMLDPRIGRSCLFDQSCDGLPIICDRFQNNATNYCTQPCSTIADCPCEGGDWVCDLIPGRSAVQKYCRDRRRIR